MFKKYSRTDQGDQVDSRRLKLSAASCGESSIFKRNKPHPLFARIHCGGHGYALPGRIHGGR